MTGCTLIAVACLARAGAPSPLSLAFCLGVFGALLGVPHGALDHLRGARLLTPRFGRAWPAIFFPAYVAGSLAVLACWRIAPLPTLITFLSASAIHWGAGDVARDLSPPRLHAVEVVARGALTVVVAALRFPREYAEALGWLLPRGAATDAALLGGVQASSRALALLLAPALALFLAHHALAAVRARSARHALAAAEIVTLALTFALLHPFLSFAIYFCLWHSARAVLRLAAEIAPDDAGLGLRRFAWRAAPLSAVTLLLMVLAWRALAEQAGTLPATLCVVVQGLSALTFPHMIVNAAADRLAARAASGPGADGARTGPLPGAGEPRAREAEFDYVLVGGGLQNALIALAILSRRRGARVAMIERDARLGGNHTWSLHADDVPEAARSFVEPLIEHRWPGYEIAFPSFRRSLATPYATITSRRLHEVIEDRIGRAAGCALLLGTEAREVTARAVVLADGRRLTARLVVDARGPDAVAASDLGRCAYQKFLGLEVRLARSAGVRVPMLMDATVEQRDGFRFVYTLPFEPDRLLVEDTYYSDTPRLDLPRLREGIMAYLEARGLVVEEVIREETGVLPLPFRGGSPKAPEGLLVAGYQGGWFHPTTGYSIPIAVRLARLVAETEPEDLFGEPLRAMAQEHRRQARFCHLLNRLLFQAFAGEARWGALERFYRVLPEASVRRFYALTLLSQDRARILCGRPPRGISVRPLLGALLEETRG